MDIYLPNELIILILSFIKDTHTYLNSRLVCRLWYNILNNGKIFKNNKLTHIATFNPKYFETKTINGVLVKKIKFLSYGRYIYNEYNLNGISKEIKCRPPFEIESIEHTPFSKTTKTYSILHEKLKSNIINYVPFNCSIS